MNNRKLFNGVNDRYLQVYKYKSYVGIKKQSKNVTIFDNDIPWRVVFKKIIYHANH